MLNVLIIMLSLALLHFFYLCCYLIQCSLWEDGAQYLPLFILSHSQICILNRILKLLQCRMQMMPSHLCEHTESICLINLSKTQKHFKAVFKNAFLLPLQCRFALGNSSINCFCFKSELNTATQSHPWALTARLTGSLSILHQ